MGGHGDDDDWRDDRDDPPPAGPLRKVQDVMRAGEVTPSVVVLAVAQQEALPRAAIRLVPQAVA